MAKTKTTRTAPAVNAVDLSQLRALWANIESLLAQTEDPNLQSALTTAALKVFIAEANKLIATLDKNA